MGRHRKHPTTEGNVKKPTEFTDHEEVDERVEDRLGLNDSVCSDCNARNSADADKCRKCGCTQLRRKAKDYRND